MSRGTEEESVDDDSAEGDDYNVPWERSKEDIAQAFSHFTYRYSRRKLLVCDLQGEEKASQTSSGLINVVRSATLFRRESLALNNEK